MISGPDREWHAACMFFLEFAAKPLQILMIMAVIGKIGGV